MVLLIAFAFVAGVGTALSPCVLPVLPGVLSAALDVSFGARRVFLVLGSPEGERTMRVLLDGRPIPDRLAGEDVHDGSVTVSGQRLYRLVELPQAGRHTLTLEPEPGIEGYAFTFG